MSVFPAAAASAIAPAAIAIPEGIQHGGPAGLDASPTDGVIAIPGAGSGLQAAEILRKADAADRLESILPHFYDHSTDPTSAAPVAGMEAPDLAPSLISPAARLFARMAQRPDEVRKDYTLFLADLGFRDYPAAIAGTLEQSGLTDLQKKVLQLNARRYRTIPAARDLAAEIMAGLSEQGYSAEAMSIATELAARLLSLQPLDPPSSLPAEVASGNQDAIRDWLIAVTIQKLSGQLIQVVSDVAKAAVPPQLRSAGLAALDQGNKGAPAALDLTARLERLKALAETGLVVSYTDATIGQTRYAGRALAASLVRFSRNSGRPEIAKELREKLARRGLHLENFIGDTVILPDRDSSRPVRIKLHTGDFIGERSAGREASEIGFSVRPQPKLWLKAYRAKLLGPLLGLWAEPKKEPVMIPGQPVRNRLKQILRAFKAWLSKQPILQHGYSHLGMAVVEESDGLSMVWAMDNYPNAEEGGIRKIGIAENFALPGEFMRFGAGHYNAQRVWDDFHAQHQSAGYQNAIYRSGKDLWTPNISRADYAALLAIPRREAGKLAAEVARRAATTIEEMLWRFGMGFAYDFVNEMWRGYCSSTVMLAYHMGAEFEIQDRPDHWNPLILLLKKLGMPGTEIINPKERIIWPSAIFIDPKIESYASVDYPSFGEAGKLAAPLTMPAYVGMDPGLTASLQHLVQLSGAGSLTPDEDLVTEAIRQHLDSRADKTRAKVGFHSGATTDSGYSAALDRLLRESDGHD